MSLPDLLTINAWTGEPVVGPPGPNAARFGARRQQPTPPRFLAADDPVPLLEWESDAVGWGLILPDNDALSDVERATAIDAPDAIQALVDARGDAPVFRYREDLRHLKLRRYGRNGHNRDLDLVHSRRGIGEQKLPQYFLIYGPPDVIPWRFQYVLGQTAFVGRLDLDGEGLERYVNALLDNWSDAASHARRPVVWSVDHGRPDITWLMRRAIAKPVAKRLGDDDDIADDLRFITGDDATVANLTRELAARQPALVVTTSHGMTGPLNDQDRMLANLGLLVDDHRALLKPADLLNAWQPDGAIWYAHACCSAGSDAATSYEDLLTPGSKVEQVLTAVAGLGAHVAPLPRALLGATKPLRAFVGQVEPTFDWTMRAETGQVLTERLCDSIYPRMHLKKPEPVGMAFHPPMQSAGAMFAQLDSLRRDIADAVEGAKEAAIRTHLTALDHQSMVILGDPTAVMPSLVDEGVAT